MTQTFNEHLLGRLEAIQQALMAHHSGGASLPSAVKGSEREAFVREFLQQVFPLPYRFGSGAITDASGNCSGQLDIVAEYPFLPSFPMPGGSQRLYMAESVAMTVEVKSDLSGQWEEVERSVRKLRTVRRRWGSSTRVAGSMIGFSGPSVTTVPYVAVGYTGFKSPEALESRLLKTADDSRPYGALVVESGAFVSPRVQARGAIGLYAFCLVMIEMFKSVSHAEVEMTSYIQGPKQSES